MRAILCITILSAACAMAQPPRGFYAWWESPVVRDLNLNEDQMKQIRAAVRESRSRLIDVRGAVEKAEFELEDLFNDEQLDTRKATEAIDKLVVARGEMTRAISLMSLKLRGVLTSQQWRELQRRRPQPQPNPMPGAGPQPNRGPGMGQGQGMGQGRGQGAPAPVRRPDDPE